MVLVRFSPHAKADDILKFLDTYQAKLVDGPRAGMFKLRLGSPESKDELASVAERMQTETSVISFAAPAE